MKFSLCLFSFSVLTLTLVAGETYMVGHSLVNHEMPPIIAQIGEDLGNPDHIYRESIVNGASLRAHWQLHDQAEGGADSWVDLPTGNYDTLLLTEQVPVQISFKWNSPVEYAQQFIDLALPVVPALRVYLYQTWPHLTNASPRAWVQDTWDEEMDVDLTLFEGAADTLEATRNLANPVYIVPAGLAVRSLRDAIAAGTVPGLSRFEDLFRDDIHMDREGNYFIACVFYATFHGQSPEGATGVIYNQWGNVYVDVPQDRKQRYQEIAWQVVSGYARSGVGGSTIPTPTAVDDQYNMHIDAEPSAANLVGHWPFDEQEGGVAEASTGQGYGRHTHMDPANVGVPGRIGRALRFDGVDDYVDFSGAEALQPAPPFTIMAWYQGVAGNRSPLLASGFSYGQRTGFRIEGFERPGKPRARARFGNGGTAVTVATPTYIPENTWTHLAVAYDGQTLELFENGALVHSRTLSGLTYDEAKLLTVGAQPDGGFYFQGDIDDLRVYNRVLDGPEIGIISLGTEAVLAVAAPGVLANDDHGQACTVQLVAGPDHGELMLAEDGAFSYTPDPDFSGSDQFTYRAELSGGGSDEAVVNLTVTRDNRTPVAANDIFQFINPAGPSLMGYWPMEEEEGVTIADASGNDHHGVISGMSSAGMAQPGMFGNCLVFDGVDDHVDLGAFPTLRSATFTIAAWYHGSPTNRSPLFSSGFDYSLRTGLRLEGFEHAGDTRARARAGDGVEAETAKTYTYVAPDHWNHLCVSYDGVDLRLYLNGQLQSSRALSGIEYHEGRIDTIGAELGGGTRFEGLIDDVRYYNEALSDDGVAVLAGTAPYLSGGVLGNDHDPDGDPLTVILLNPPDHGTFYLKQDGSFTYTPDPGFSGTDSFTYRLSDGRQQSSPATVSLNITDLP